MKSNYLKTGSLLCLLLITSLLSFTCRAEEAASNKTKKVTQNYKVGANDLLEVDNSYGKITITHWDKMEADIVVEVEANARNDKRVEEILDMVKVEIDNPGSTVRVRASTRNMRISGHNERVNVSIQITIPSSMNLALSQKYGDIMLADNHKGKGNLEVKYGNIRAGNFLNDLNVDASYSNLDFGNAKNLRMDLSYCGKANFKNIPNVTGDLKYSNIVIGNMDNCRIECRYGNMEAGAIGSAQLDFRYSNGSVQSIQKDLHISSLDYGTLSVRELSADFSSVRAEAKYGNLNLHIPSNATFNVTAESMKYGNLEINGFSAQQQKEGTTIRAQVNNGNNNRRIDFNGGNYSNLKIRSL